MAAWVLSSVLLVSLCRSLATVPETDQSLTLIRSEWSRRRDRELCDYWTSTLYQFQSFYNTRLSRTRCIIHPVWSAGDPVILVFYWSWAIFLHLLWGRIHWVIKSATGSNLLIALKDQSCGAERGTPSPLYTVQLLCKKLWLDILKHMSFFSNALLSSWSAKAEGKKCCVPG